MRKNRKTIALLACGVAAVMMAGCGKETPELQTMSVIETTTAASTAPSTSAAGTSESVPAGMVPITSASSQTTTAIEHEIEPVPGSVSIIPTDDPLYNWDMAAYNAMNTVDKSYNSDAAFMKDVLNGLTTTTGSAYDPASLYAAAEKLDIDAAGPGDVIIFFDKNGKPEHVGILVSHNSMMDLDKGKAVRRHVTDYGFDFAFVRLFDTSGIDAGKLSDYAENGGYIHATLVTGGIDTSTFDNKTDELAAFINNSIADGNPVFRPTEIDVTSVDTTRWKNITLIQVLPDTMLDEESVLYHTDTGDFTFGQ